MGNHTKFGNFLYFVNPRLIYEIELNKHLANHNLNKFLYSSNL